MLRFVSQIHTSPSTSLHTAGVLEHSSGQVSVWYNFFSSTEGVAQALLDFCQEQFDQEVFQTSLEFHQFLERIIQTSQRMNVETSLVGVAHSAERIAFAAYHGSVILKRQQKVGKILTAESELQLIEGKYHPGDAYVLVGPDDEHVTTAVHAALSAASEKQALSIFDRPELQKAFESNAEGERKVGAAVVMLQEVSEAVETPALLETAQHYQETQASLVSTQASAPAAPTQTFAQKMQPFLAHLSNAGLFANKITNTIKSEVGRFSSNDVYVRRQQRKSLGRILIVAVVIIFGVVGVFAYMRNRQAQQRQEVAQALAPFAIRLNEVETEVELNPVGARQKTEDMINELDILSKKADQPKHLSTAYAEELEKTRDFYATISGQEELSVLPTFFDLRLVQSNFLANAMDITTDTLFFLDGGQRKVLALNIEKKQPTLLPIGEYPDLRAMAADNSYLYFLSQGLFRFTLSGTDVAKLVENPDDTITNGQSLGVYGSNVYVLNKEKNNIFRYATDDDQLNSTPSGWVQSGQSIDFATVQNFSIDRDIWMGTQIGEIKKFSSGREAEFAVQGMPEPFTTPINVFTKPEYKNIYVLESQKSRMVVISKEGAFLKEVKSSTLAASTSVVASETLNKVFALSGSLVFEIQL